MKDFNLFTRHKADGEVVIAQKRGGGYNLHDLQSKSANEKRACRHHWIPTKLALEWLGSSISF